MTDVTYEVDGGTAIITIEREEKLNALDENVIQGLRSAFRRFDLSAEKCAILAASGERAFSVGADIKNPPKEMWQGVPGVGVPQTSLLSPVFRGIVLVVLIYWCRCAILLLLPGIPFLNTPRHRLVLQGG